MGLVVVAAIVGDGCKGQVGCLNKLQAFIEPVDIGERLGGDAHIVEKQLLYIPFRNAILVRQCFNAKAILLLPEYACTFVQ